MRRACSVQHTVKTRDSRRMFYHFVRNKQILKDWVKVNTFGFIKPLALGRMGGRRVRLKTKGFIKPLALGESKGFEFARGGEGVGKGGVKG